MTQTEAHASAGAQDVSPALRTAAAFLDAWTAGDMEQAGQYLAETFVFDGPVAHYRSAAEFLAGSRQFAQALRPGWAEVSAFGDTREALLLYDLHLAAGATMRVADHYRVSDGKIQAETILWDTGAAARQSPRVTGPAGPAPARPSRRSARTTGSGR